MSTTRRPATGRLVAFTLVVASALATAQPPASATPYGEYDVTGSIEVTYLQKGGPDGFLGLPLTNENPTADSVGRFNRFQGGAIYWNRFAFEVHGAIYSRWEALGPQNTVLGPGPERGVLGYPVSNEDTTPDGVGRVNHFQNGKIYWTPTTGAHEVYGAILSTWVSLGYETSALGYPISGEYAVPGGRRNDFQGGNITFTRTGGSVVTLDRPADPNTITGAGSQVVPVSKPNGPALVRSRTTGAPGSEFFAVGLVAGEPNELLASGVAPYDGVAPVDFRYDGPSTRTTEIAVESETTWALELIPLAASGTFAKGQTIGESRSTVWRYTGRAGTARLTHTSGAGEFSVYSFDASTADPKVLTEAEGFADVYVPIEANQVVQIVSDGSWAITVV